MALLQGPDIDTLARLAKLSRGCSHDVFIHELCAALNASSLLPLAAYRAAVELFDHVHPADPDVCMADVALWAAEKLNSTMVLSADAAAVVEDLMISICAKGEPSDPAVCRRLAAAGASLVATCSVLCCVFLSLLLSAPVEKDPAAPLEFLASAQRWPHAVAVVMPS